MEVLKKAASKRRREGSNVTEKAVEKAVKELCRVLGLRSAHCGGEPGHNPRT